MKNSSKNSIVGIGLAVFFVLGFTGPINVLAFSSPAPVNLLSAGNFVVLAKSGISTTGATLITGNVGISPAAASYLSGFSETMDVSNQFSTSAYVIGKLYAADYAVPTPTYVGTAIGAMAAAYTDANSRAVDATDPGAPGTCATTCDLAGLVMAPGVYKFSGPGNVIITGDVTLNGSASDVWIFQIPGTLDISTSKKVLLTGGAVPENVFWAVAGATTLEVTSTFEGNILEAGSVIAIQTGAILHGRALSQFAVTLDANPISLPSGSIPDTTAPVITMNGATPIALTVGDSFTDPYATALDDIDGPIPVTFSGLVDTATVGSYIITYNTVDSAGNHATPVTRTINVNVAPVPTPVPDPTPIPEPTPINRSGSSHQSRVVTTEALITPVFSVTTPNVIIPVVFTPGFPDTGLPPRPPYNQNTPWYVIILTIIPIIILSTALALIPKKYKV